jgi:tetratricopeptide (TPR) repeat protein
MIVKNESKIITRLLDSVIPLIDCYCICDTGSTDNTVELIQNYFHEKNITGKIVFEKFVNFCHNRTFSLTQCVGMSDYVLLLDADMILEINAFDKSMLKNADSFTILQGNDSFYYQNMRIVKNNGLYNYVGVTHEYINTPSNNTIFNFKKDQLFIRDIGDGGAKSDKFERDVRLLQQGIIDEPNNARYYFYLANSYHDNGNYNEAIKYYEKRIQFGGWEQEVWYSHYRIGLCYKNLNCVEKAIFSWLEGYNYLPERLEGLYEIIKYYRESGKQRPAIVFYDCAKKILLQNKDREHYLFLHNDVYTYKLHYEYTICAGYVGIQNISDEIITVLNNSCDINVSNNLLSNMKFYNYILTKNNTVSLDNSMMFDINDSNNVLTSSSSSLIKNNDFGYTMNIRYVNYIIDNTGNYLNCDTNVTTVNKCVKLDNNLNKVSEHIFSKMKTDNRYIGIEDVKIFQTKHKILFTGTGYNVNNRPYVVIGDYDLNNHELIGTKVNGNFINHDCEKNWVLVEYDDEPHFVYKWNPLQICKIDANENCVEVISSKPMPNIFNFARGSTCGFKYEKIHNSIEQENLQLMIMETEIWFVVHIVSYESPRHYYHMLVVFDDSMNLLRYSAPFKFDGTPIEYCLGLVVEDERVLITYSNWDRTSRIGVYDKNYIDSIMKYT